MSRLRRIDYANILYDYLLRNRIKRFNTKEYRIGRYPGLKNKLKFGEMRQAIMELKIQKKIEKDGLKWKLS